MRILHADPGNLVGKRLNGVVSYLKIVGVVHGNTVECLADNDVVHDRHVREWRAVCGNPHEDALNLCAPAAVHDIAGYDYIVGRRRVPLGPELNSVRVIPTFRWVALPMEIL